MIDHSKANEIMAKACGSAIKTCAKCGKPTTDIYQAFDALLCKACASWFGYSMVKLRATLNTWTSA